jgi:putative DNA primase/helicase
MNVLPLSVGRASAGSPALELHLGPASTLHPWQVLDAAIKAGDWSGAKRLNAEMAAEFPLVPAIEYWFLRKIGEEWGEVALTTARREWAERRKATRGRLAGLSGRLEAAKPKIEDAKAELAELSERLATVRVVEPEPQIVWETAKLGTAPVLSKAAPMDNARAFAKDRLWVWAKDTGIGSLATRHWRDKWWQWNGSFYELVPKQRISDQVYFYLDQAQIGTGNDAQRFKPKPDDATKLMSCLEPCVGLDDRSVPPRWFDDRREPNAMNLLAFRNCLVDAVTGKTLGPTPELWLHEGVDFDYDPKARCPRWDEFLCEMFPNDPGARMTIEEHLGLGMTRDGQFEKAAMWIGATRSGRGTLCRVQELLVGPNGHSPLNIHTWNKGENSKQGMVGKRVGIFHDVRLKEAKAYGAVSYDPGGVEYQSLQALLEIIAGDAQSWGRKYIEAWQGVPYIKVIYVSNEPPNVNDEVLLGRFILLEFEISFKDRVDPKLKLEILPAELPGIANKCLAGYRRLLERGKFIQSKSGLALLQKIKEKGNMYLAFMNACFVPDPTGPGILVTDFRDEFVSWCINNRRLDKIKQTASTIITEVNKIPEWKHLESFKLHGKSQRYPLKLKRGS